MNRHAQEDRKRAFLRKTLLNSYYEIFNKLNRMSTSSTSETGRHSQENLSAFLTLQQLRLNQIEGLLVEEGLTSLKDIRPHVLYSMQKMLLNLGASLDTKLLGQIPPDPPLAEKIRQDRNKCLLGQRHEGSPAVMVTLHSSMLSSPSILTELLDGGMTIARINCAHDTPNVWKRLVDHVRFAERQKSTNTPPCKIYMDLAGPKIRVGRIIKEDSGMPSKNPGLIEITEGDRLRIYKGQLQSGHPASGTKPAAISITVPGALANVRKNDPIFIDDGKISGRAAFITDDYIEMEVITTLKEKLTLKEGKGINIPDSFVYWTVPAITKEDEKNLPLICELADMIGISFIHHPYDLKKLSSLIRFLTNKPIGVIAKIETKAAVHHLSKIIIEGLQMDPFGVMIARGDLAVEVGFHALSAVQENILSVCEAAHVPVIWATGVLEKMTKKGIPTRAELTDAYMGVRADCIMLNKGSYIVDSVKMLQNIEKCSRQRSNEDASLMVQYGF